MPADIPRNDGLEHRGSEIGKHGGTGANPANLEFWSGMPVEMPQERNTIQVTARFDRDVVDWFRSHGRGYQARMNAVLRSFFEAHKDDPP